MGTPGTDLAAAALLGEKVSALYRRKRTPDGKPYTLIRAAAEMGIDYSYLSKLLRGKVQSPGPTILQKLSAFFEVTPDYWLGQHHPGKLDSTPTGAMLARMLAELGEEDQQRVAAFVAALKEQANS